MRWAVLLCCCCWADTGSRACAPCHAEIYAKYQKTGMARSSGPVGDGFERFDKPEFTVAGARYRVGRNFAVEFEKGAVKGSFPMEWFIGSGAVGRSYAGSVEGFLFQSPASYYSARGQWSLSPGFGAYDFVNVARPIEDACLQCHASGAIPEGGVGCEKCHGPGDAHVAGKGSMVNPAKMAPERRDSVCQQCHLTGAARIARPGRGPQTFRAGEILNDHLMVFVWSGGEGRERTATDHAEQLARSKCQQAAGDKLWCGTCHDAHAGSTRAEACLDCHKPHTGGGADCAGCHMPKGRSREGEHVVYTDHTIRRKPGSASPNARVLQEFRGMRATDRDWALAEPARRADTLERLAARQDADVAVLVQLAQIYDGRRLGAKAAGLYERILKLEPDHATARANLGIYRMQAGRVKEALALWSSAFATDPAMIGPGLNLAMGQLQAGDRAGALVTLRRVLRFHPDSSKARELLRGLL